MSYRAPVKDMLFAIKELADIDAVVNTAKGRGWPAEQIHLEYFGAAPQDTSGDKAFDVKLASSGKVIRVAADQSVVQALAALAPAARTAPVRAALATVREALAQRKQAARQFSFAPVALFNHAIDGRRSIATTRLPLQPLQQHCCC